LYLIHHAYAGGTQEQLTTLVEAQAAGLIRHFGLSNCEDIEVLTELKANYPIFANQIQAVAPGGEVFSHTMRPPTFVADCNALGIVTMLYASISGISMSPSLYNDPIMATTYFEISTKINKYYTQKYIVGQSNVLIVGSRSGSTLQRNMVDFTNTLAKQDLLSEDEMTAIEEFLQQVVLGPMNR
jgi:diketogulonate reductase-like aldo/keto reductase